MLILACNFFKKLRKKKTAKKVFSSLTWFFIGINHKKSQASDETAKDSKPWQNCHPDEDVIETQLNQKYIRTRSSSRY